MSSMFANMAAQVAGNSYRPFVLLTTACDILDAPVAASATAYRAAALGQLLAIQAAGASRGFAAAFVAREGAVRQISAAFTSIGVTEPTHSRTASQINALVPVAT